MRSSDGGPAFPQLGIDTQAGFNHAKGQLETRERVFTNGGMSLRDYFAAQALAGQMAYEGAEGCGLDAGAGDVAKWCYGLADALLAEKRR